MPKARTAVSERRELIYVINGKDESLVNLRYSELLDELIAPAQRVTDLFDADPAKVSIADIFDELRTLPFLADKRVVVIKGADKFISDNRELLEGYFDNPCSTGVLILTVGGWSARTRLAGKLLRVGRLLEALQPKPWQLPQRLIRYARDAHNKSLAGRDAELLIELAGDELVRLYSEIDKLALFATDDKVVTTEHIESLVGHNRFFNAFAVIDAVTAGDTAQAIDRLRRMFAEDKSAEYSVVGAFAFQLRKMFRARVLLEKGARPADIAKQLRIWGNIDAFFSRLRRMSLQQIGSFLQQLAETDYAIKTGRTRPPVAMEQLVLRLAVA